jgi:hypothetical protein
VLRISFTKNFNFGIWGVVEILYVADLRDGREAISPQNERKSGTMKSFAV